MSRVSKLAIASLTALGLAITPISATAGPSQEDVAKTLAGLAILGSRRFGLKFFDVLTKSFPFHSFSFPPTVLLGSIWI